MARVNATLSSIKARIERLSQIVEDLRAGKSFSVTRLTSIKGLCTDSNAGQAFALYIAGLARLKMDTR